VRELTLAYTISGELPYTLVGVGSACVAPYPWLLCVASHPNSVTSCVVLWDDVVVVSHVVRPPNVRGDADFGGVSGVGDLQRGVNARSIEILSLA